MRKDDGVELAANEIRVGVLRVLNIVSLKTNFLVRYVG